MIYALIITIIKPTTPVSATTKHNVQIISALYPTAPKVSHTATDPTAIIVLKTAI